MQTSRAQRWSRYLIYFILATLPLERIPSFDIFNYTVRLSQVAGVLLVLINLPLILSKLRQLTASPWRWLSLFIVVTAISALQAVDFERAATVTAFTGFMTVLAWVIALRFEREKLGTYGRILIASAVTVCIFGLYQFVGDLVGLPPHFTGLREHYTSVVFGFPRIQSTALEPLYFANYLLIPMSLLVSMFMFGQQRRAWPLLFILTIIWMTLSRGAFAAAVMTILAAGAIGWFYKVPKRSARLAGLGVLSIALAFGLIALGASIDREASTSSGGNVSRFTRQSTNVSVGESSEGRALTRQLALDAFKESPLLGLGPGNFGIYANQREPLRFETTDLIVNNEPLELLAETGIVGLLSFLLFAAALLWRSIKTLMLDRSANQIWLCGLLAALVGIAIQYQTFSTLYITHVWVTIGLLAGLTSAAKSPAKQA